MVGFWLPLSLALLLAVLAAVFATGATFVGNVAYQRYQKANMIESYQYAYFGDQAVNKGRKETAARKNFLNKLDLAKNTADNSLEAYLRDTAQIHLLTQVRKVNDYAFRVFRDMWFVQDEWYQRNGRYFQGKETVKPFPPLGKNAAVTYLQDSGLSHQIENWNDVGYRDEYVPVSIRSDVYSGPKGDGYIVTIAFNFNKKDWKIYMHEGPEDRGESFVWSPAN